MRVHHFYKALMRHYHDKKIIKREFKEGYWILLFNSKIWLFPEKLKSKWSELFQVIQVFPHGTIELEYIDGSKFKVNG